MKKVLYLLSFMLLFATAAYAQGYKVGDIAEDFSLKNVDGKQVSLADYPDAKGFIVVFTCNHCPFAQAYEQRIIDIHKAYISKGYPVVAINPNDPEIQPDDSYEAMQQRAEEKEYPFPYLFDASQEVYRKYGASRTPHVFLLIKEDGKLKVSYIGTVDDNYKDESAVTHKYLADAIDALIAGKEPDPSFTKAIGCSIKDKRNQ